MTTATPPTTGSKADLVRWSFDALNRRDMEAMRQIFTETTVERFPDRTCHGVDEIVAYFEQTMAAIPDWHIEAVAIAEQDDEVFVQWRLTGTHSGTLLGIEATGKSLEIDGMDHFTIRDGKIVTNFVIVDQLQYARQIGMMPPEDSVGDKAFKAAFNARTKLVGALRR